jgi:DNA polymerase-3 subunit alpha
VQSTIGELEISNSNAVVIAGIVLSARVITTRTGKRMAIMTLEDLSGRIDITLFSETYQQVAQQLEKDSIFLVKGTVSKDDYTGGIKMVAEGIIPLEEARQRMSRQLMLRVFDEKTVDRILRELPQLLKQFGEGRCPIKIVYQAGEQGAELKLGDAWRIKPCSELLTELYKLCGRDNVVLEYT